MTANDLITAAMYKINAIAPGENPTAAEAAAALAELNDMLDGWQTESLMLWAIQRQLFPLIVGQQAYTVGPGGNFNIPRPVRIERVGIINLGNPSQPLELPIQYLTEAQWSMVPVKNIASSLPQAVWDDQGFPWRTLYYWCIPNTAVETALYTWITLGSFADLATDYSFPPGYADALKYNLAYRISADFGGFMPPQLAGLAMEAKARVKSLNIPLIDLRCDDALVASGRRQYNWITDSPIGSR